MKSYPYIGPAYRPHPAIPRVDSAVHALTQWSSGSKIPLHDLNTYCHSAVNDHHCKIERAGFYAALVVTLIVRKHDL